MKVYKCKARNFHHGWGIIALEEWKDHPSSDRFNYVVTTDSTKEVLRVNHVGAIDIVTVHSNNKDAIMERCIPSNKLELLVMHGLTEADIEEYIEDAGI